MEAKTVFVFCLHLFFVKSILTQCIGTPAYIPEAYGIVGTGIPSAYTSQLTMQIPAMPSPSFSIFSDGLVVDGLVSVSGSLPFLGTVTLGGTVPAAGQGSVLYNCGNGEVGIFREMPAARAPTALYY